ncbi:MAG TPA: DUF2628 domain-containing protein [Firmicutes bacterium]|nr:DUF2628 domain-containing protein [Bacillota bacterium]
MFFYEGYICPVCGKKFQETDDIVTCPECGAPHHRACWQQEGHCHFAADHGTPRQWKRPEEPSGVPDHRAGPAASSHGPQAAPPPSSGAAGGRICPRCGKANLEYAEFCSQCGYELPPADWRSGPAQQTPPNCQQPPYQQPPYQQYRPQGSPYYPGGYGEYSPFRVPVVDPLGGVPQGETIDGERVEDVAAFVGPNSAYYLPRFYKMARTGSRLSWNWPAFLITPYWLLYRKQYVPGGILLGLEMVKTFLEAFILGTYIYPQLDMTSTAAMYQSMFSQVQGGRLTIYFAILSLMTVISLLLRVLFGLIGNSLYRRGALKKVKAVREKQGNPAPVQPGTTDGYLRQALTQSGGVSLVLVAASAGIIWFAQILFQTLFLYTL